MMSRQKKTNRQPTAKEMLQEEYNRLSTELKMHRERYLLLQTQYPPESLYLIKELKKLSSVLNIIKADILQVHAALATINEREALLPKKSFFSKVLQLA